MFATNFIQLTLILKTQKGEDGYSKYRRRSTDDRGFKVSIKSIDFDKKWAVPYNPVLFCTIIVHINIEIES
jgi:hypothetical protein